MPILDNFLFELEGNQLRLSGSDLESSMMTEIEVQGNEDGAAAIAAKLLLDTLKTFPEQPLTFQTDSASNQVEISSEFGEYAIGFENPDDFPKAHEVENPASIELPTELVATAISKTIFATGNDDLRPMMSGVYFEFSQEGLNFVATDAHKLVRYRRNDHKAKEDTNFIMPKKPLTLLRNTLAMADGNVTIEYNEQNARFSFENSVLSCRLIDGKYPNYEAVIPNENPNVLTIDRQAFLSSVKRVSIFSNKTTHQIRLKMAGTELHVSAEDLDFGNDAEERLTAQYDGNDMAIGFNSRFLIEMLTNLESDHVHLEMSEPNRAGILLPADSMDEGEEVLMLVMPVMLNN